MNTNIPIEDCPVLVPVLNHADAGRIAIERGYTDWMYVQRGQYHYMLVSLYDFERGRTAANEKG